MPKVKPHRDSIWRTTICENPVSPHKVVTLCPDRDYVTTQRPAIEKVIRRNDVSRVYLSQFFPIESAWWRLKQMER
jgi:hypothetical protein